MWRELLFGEREVFTTFDQEQYGRAVQSLRANGVPYRTKMKYTGGSVMRGGRMGGFGENPRVTTQFSIYVKKAVWDKACYAVRNR